MSRDDGARGVIREALAGAAAQLAQREGAQAALFADGEASLPAGGYVAPGEAAANGARERKAGRPPGSTNLATRELRKAMHAVGLDSVWTMARWALLTPEELAARLGCTRLEAFDRLRALWAEIAPYQHARLAPTDGAGNVAPMMVMAIGGTIADPAQHRPPWEHDRLGLAREAPIEQNQGLGEASAGASVAPPSRGSEKP